MSLFITLIKPAPLDTNHLFVGVWLSGASYCGKENYKSMNIGGPATGFAYADTIYDPKTDLQGYIGTLSTLRTIYVVLRGSSSIMNWLDDFEVKLIPYASYQNCNCSIHNGFYNSALNVKNKTIETVQILKKRYPTYSVVVTGHSYGASCGQILAMELEKAGIETKVYNYGQPRVGDKRYAKFVNDILKEYWRTTHNKDIVPHVPPITGFNYYHSCREVFEDKNGSLNICSDLNCEDPKCTDQYSLADTNGDDHTIYLGHGISCEASVL
jgi:hypothetical protein